MAKRNRLRLTSTWDWFVGITRRLRLSQYGLIFSTREQTAKGANIASASAITLGADGNVFPITGTTTINHITKTNWQAGSVITLLFSTSLTVTHNAGTVPATAQPILLSAAGNFSATANDSLTLVNDGTSWREIGRAVI